LDQCDHGAAQANLDDIRATTGSEIGCTLRLVGDFDKMAAAYHRPESLLWRDAGVVIAAICLLAEWLELASVPLGFVGSAHLQRIGFPTERFMGLGAVLVSGNCCDE
jgi:hypothetical protein